MVNVEHSLLHGVKVHSNTVIVAVCLLQRIRVGPSTPDARDCCNLVSLGAILHSLLFLYIPLAHSEEAEYAPINCSGFVAYLL